MYGLSLVLGRPGKDASLSLLESRIAAAASDSLAVAVEGVDEAAVKGGLPLEVAGSFARQALAGAALVLESGVGSPALLKDRVASPGGTTIQGLAALEDAAVRGALMGAVKAATSGKEKGSKG